MDKIGYDKGANTAVRLKTTAPDTIRMTVVKKTTTASGRIRKITIESYFSPLQMQAFARAILGMPEDDDFPPFDKDKNNT